MAVYEVRSRVSRPPKGHRVTGLGVLQGTGPGYCRTHGLALPFSLALAASSTAVGAPWGGTQSRLGQNPPEMWHLQYPWLTRLRVCLLSTYWEGVEGFKLTYELLLRKVPPPCAPHRPGSPGEFYIHRRDRQASILPVPFSADWQLMRLVPKPANICTPICTPACTFQWRRVTVKQVVNDMYIKFIGRLVIFHYHCQFAVYMVRIFGIRPLADLAGRGF